MLCYYLMHDLNHYWCCCSCCCCLSWSWSFVMLTDLVVHRSKTILCIELGNCIVDSLPWNCPMTPYATLRVPCKSEDTTSQVIDWLSKCWAEWVIASYLNDGILLSNVSKTVTSPFNGAWFASNSCFSADMLMLNSLKISVLPRTPGRSRKEMNVHRQRFNINSHFHKCRQKSTKEKKCRLHDSSHSYLAIAAQDSDTMQALFQWV